MLSKFVATFLLSVKDKKKILVKFTCLCAAVYSF